MFGPPLPPICLRRPLASGWARLGTGSSPMSPRAAGAEGPEVDPAARKKRRLEAALEEQRRRRNLEQSAEIREGVEVLRPSAEGGGLGLRTRAAIHNPTARIPPPFL